MLFMLFLTLSCGVKGQSFTYFTFNNISANDRYGVVIENGSEPWEGTVELRKVRTERSLDVKEISNKVCSWKVSLPSFGKQILYTPLDQKLEYAHHRFYFKTKGSEEFKNIHIFTLINTFYINDSLTPDLHLLRIPAKWNTGSHFILLGSVKYLPEKSENYFFNRLAIGIRQLEELPESDFQNLKKFTINGGLLTLIDDLPSNKKPGKRVLELLPLQFGKKENPLPRAIVEAMIKAPCKAKSLPLTRDFSYRLNNQQINPGLPGYITKFGRGVVYYLGFDIKDIEYAGILSHLRGPRLDYLYSDSKLLKSLSEAKEETTKFDIWEYLFKILANPLVLLAVCIVLFNFVFSFILHFRLKKGRHYANQKSFLPLIWKINSVIVVIIFLTHFVLGSKGLAYNYFEKEFLFPGAEMSKIEESTYISTQTPLNVTMEWQGNSPQINYAEKKFLYRDKDFFSSPTPRLRLNTQGKRLLGGRSIVAANKFLQGKIKLDENGKISGEIINSTDRDFTWNCLIVPVCRGDRVYDTFADIVPLPPLKAGDKHILKDALHFDNDTVNIGKTPDIILNYFSNSIERQMRFFTTCLPGNSCYFIGGTNQYYFQPIFNSTKTPAEKNKVVIQKLPYAFKRNYFLRNTNLRLGKEFSILPEKTASGTTGAEPVAEKGQSKVNLKSYETLLFNSGVIGNKLIPLNIQIKKLYLTLDYRTIAQKNGNSGFLYIDALNLKTGKWELLHKENLAPLKEDVKILRKILEKFRKMEVSKEEKQYGFEFGKMFKKKRKIKGEGFGFGAMFGEKSKKGKKDTPKADIVIELNNLPQYFQTNYSEIYFRFTHKGDGERVVIHDPELEFE